MKKVCIIGGGTAGLCSARRALENNIEPVVYEQNDRIGGTWVYTDKTGTDEYDIDIHTSMYQGLRFTNLPKEVMGYPDFPISSQENVSYVPSQTVLNFLEDYADFHGIRKYIKFLHYVIRVRPTKNNMWEVIVNNLQEQETIQELYDFVLVCNGHYHTPLYPNIKGMTEFRGKSLHSHEFRHAQIFEGETVLIIGAGPSGMDLCHEISKYAKYVDLSHHSPEPFKTQYKPNVRQKPDVTKFDETGVYFTDNSYEKYTFIFYCTGYKYAFTFLSIDCGIYVEDNHVKPLFKQCINIKYPTMAFIGIPYYVCAAQMMDLQARFVFKYYTQSKQLPSETELFEITARDDKERHKKGFYGRKAHMLGPEQIHYFNDLSETAEIENIPAVMTKLHNESSKRFLDDLLNFRNDVFKIVDHETFVQIN